MPSMTAAKGTGKREAQGRGIVKRLIFGRNGGQSLPIQQASALGTARGAISGQIAAEMPPKAISPIPISAD